MAENFMEPTDAPGGMSPDTVDRILKYLSGKMSGLIPETSEDVAARRKDIGDGLGRAYDSVMNPLNAAGRLMRAPVAAGMRAVGIDAQSPYAPTAQAVQTNMNTPPVNPGFVDMPSESGAGTPLTGAFGNVGKKNTVRRQPAPGPAPLQTVMPVDEAMGPGGRYGGQSDVNAVMDDQPKPAVAAPVPAAPQKGLREDFMARLAGMNKGQDTGMTQEQKGRALMEAGLAIMAAASKPGASAMGSIGEGGQKGTAVAREMERINRERADKSRAEDRDNLRTEFTLAGQDQDRAARKEDKAETRRIREEDLKDRSEDRKSRDTTENRRIDLLGQQVEAAGWQLKDGGDGVVHAYNVRTGEDRKTPLKVRGERNQNIEFYSWMLKTPGAKELFTKSDAVDAKDEGKLRAAYGQAYLKASMDPIGDISKFPTFDEFKSKIVGGAQREAPPAAVEMLRKNPALKDSFKQKYGYLPAGM